MKFKYLMPFVLWLLFCGLTAVWLYTRPLQVSFDFEAEQNGPLRLRYSERKRGKEKYTPREAVTPWKKQYRFSLPARTRRISLVPGPKQGNRITVRDLRLVRAQIFRNAVLEPDAEILKPVRDIVPDGNGFRVTGSRPELAIAPGFVQSLKPDLRWSSLLIFLFLLGSWVLLRTGPDSWRDLGDRTVRLTENLKSYCRENRFFLIYACCCLIFLFGYELFNLPVSEDDDWYLLRQFEQHENSMPGAYSTLTYPTLEDNFIAHGRWSAALHQKIITGFCPVISLLWSLVCLSLVFLLLAEKLSLPPPGRYLLFPLFIGSPVFYEYFQFYMTNNPYGSHALIALTAAVCWSGCRNWRTLALAVLAAVFVICSLQSLILIFPLWFLLKTMSDGLDRPVQYKQSFMELLKLCGFCLLLLLGYFLALKYSLWLFDVQWQYLGDYLQRPDSLKAVLRFARPLLKKMLSVYSGQFEFPIRGQLLLFLGMTAAVLARLIRKKRSVWDIVLMAAGLAGLLILPFALDIAAFNTSIPVRSMVSLPIMMAGLCILGWRALDDCPNLRTAAGLLIVFVAVQYGILINQKAYASKLRYDQDLSALQSIKDRCYRIPEFTAARSEKKKIPLAVAGNLILPKYRSFPMWNKSLLNCEFEPAIVMNLHLLGETYFYPASTKEMKRVFPVVMSMPSWPAEGSVRYEDGIMIVKLSGFNESQCRQYEFPFRPVTGNNSIYLLKKMPEAVRPVWTLTPETLDSTDSCTVEFSEDKLLVRPSGWHSLRSRAVAADPDKIYYLCLDLRDSKKSGILYLSFSDPARYGSEIDVEADIPRGGKNVILRIPGRYLKDGFSLLLGDLPGREQKIGKPMLYELTGTEDLLAE